MIQTAFGRATNRRLGSYGFRTMRELIDSLESSGLGALELFCLGLKVRKPNIHRATCKPLVQFALK